MPKRRQSSRIISLRAKHLKRNIQDLHVHIYNEMEIKTEASDVQMESPMSILAATMAHNAANSPEIGAIKMETGINIENAYRPGMFEELNDRELKPDAVKLEQSAKREQKKKSIKRNEKQNLPKPVKPLKIIVNGQKMVECPICNKKVSAKQGLKAHIHQVHSKQKRFSCNYCTAKFGSDEGRRSHIETRHNKKRIGCEKCRAVIYEVDELNMHKFKCIANRSLQCYLCPFKSERFMHSLKEHMRRMHTGEEVFDCTFCTKKFVTKCALVKHIRQFHPETMPFECSMCQKKFQVEQSLLTHERNCRRFECHMCQYSPPSFSLHCFKLHMRTHTGVRPFDCHLCGKTYISRVALDNHLQGHSNTYTLKCPQCHRGFSNGNKLTEHQQNCRRRRYECYLCGFTRFGLSFNKFKRHMQSNHTGELARKCSGCRNSFRSYVQLAEHISKSDHKHLLAKICPNCCLHFPTRTLRDLHQSKCTRKRFECYACGKSDINMESLRTHFTQKHSLKRFKCKFCNRHFLRKLNLKSHIVTHTKVGMVKCKYCDKKFIDMRCKKKHEYSCKKRFECYLCKETFPSLQILHRKHMKTHMGRYQCRHCEKSSTSPRCYKDHLLDFHLHLYKFQCQICKRIVKKRKDLLIHQKSCMKPTRKAKDAIYFKCSLCGTALPRLPNVKEHILSGKCKNLPKKQKAK